MEMQLPEWLDNMSIVMSEGLPHFEGAIFLSDLYSLIPADDRLHTIRWETAIERHLEQLKRFHASPDVFRTNSKKLIEYAINYCRKRLEKKPQTLEDRQKIVDIKLFLEQNAKYFSTYIWTSVLSCMKTMDEEDVHSVGRSLYWAAWSYVKWHEGNEMIKSRWIEVRQYYLQKERDVLLTSLRKKEVVC
jgi:hypothetical protein